MCGLAAITPVASLAFNVVGAIGRARQQSADYRYVQQVNERNAEIERQRIADAHIRGKIEANRFRSKIEGIVGSQKAAFAGGNIDISSGSAVAFERDTRILGELDARTIENNALREAHGYALNEQRFLTEADLARSRRRSAVGTSLLSGVISTANYLYENPDALDFFRPSPVSPTAGTGGRV